MKILIQHHCPSHDFDRRVLDSLTRQVAGRVLKLHRAPSDSEISVLYVDDEEMRELNRKYRGIDRTTDVLAFPMWEGSDPAAGLTAAERMLGDVVVSLETAARQSRRRSHTPRPKSGCSTSSIPPARPST